MWIFYEHPELTQMEDILPPNEFPKLRGKARMCCIPSTSGTASEVSRSIVISDNEKGLKHGVGNMEMMPDIAICDPEVTMSMPAKITAETGMDALTHALEALASNRANYLSDILASQAAQDIMETLPTAYENGNDIKSKRDYGTGIYGSWNCIYQCIAWNCTFYGAYNRWYFPCITWSGRRHYFAVHHQI